MQRFGVHFCFVYTYTHECVCACACEMDLNKRIIITYAIFGWKKMLWREKKIRYKHMSK